MKQVQFITSRDWKKPMAKKGKHQPGSGIRGQLEKAEQLLRARKWGEAQTLLIDVTADHPNNRDAWAMLGEVLNRLKNHKELWWVAQNLLRLEPNAEENWFNAMNVAFLNTMAFTALEYSRIFLKRFPASTYAAEVRQNQALLEKATESIRTSPHTAIGSSEEDFRELEQSTIAMESGEYPLAEKLARSTIARSPHLIAPLNNLSLILAMQGRLDEAIQCAQQVLERQPDNLHVLSNQVQFHVRKGQPATAQHFAEQLLQQPADEYDLQKLVEGLTYLGDDASIVRRFEQVEKSSEWDTSQFALLYHLVGVAYAHLGDEKRAKQLWQSALKCAPGYALAQANLDNLKKPLGERVRAFPFSLQQWIPMGWLEEMGTAAERGRVSSKAFKSQMDKFLHARPEIITLMPILMERGDDHCREFVIQIGGAAQLPVLLDFALSEYGTDSERMRAAQRATELGMLPRGKTVSLVVKGRRTELLLLAYEITSEPQRQHIPASTQRLIESIHDLLSRSRYAEAEVAARVAVSKVPTEPTLWNYLMVSLQAQDKTEEAAPLTVQIAERFPDYSFGQISLARLLVEQGQIDQAHQVLDPLANRPSFHISEFTAFCIANIELLIAEKKKDAAASWLQMWEQVAPDHPHLGHYRRMIRGR